MLFTTLNPNDQIIAFLYFVINITSLNQNLENLQTHILEETAFHFDVIGISETKITNANLETSHLIFRDIDLNSCRRL